MPSLPRQSAAVPDGRGRKAAVHALILLAIAQVLALCRASSSEEPRATPKSSASTDVTAHVPHLDRDGGYVSSARCLNCHPQEHQSWSKSYHHTMTQLATPENVLGDFAGQTIQSKGVTYRVYRQGDEFWAEMPDPDALEAIVQRGRKGRIEDVPRVKRRVLMTTGSHHYQTYWVESALPFRPRLMQTLPLVYLKEDRRWIPREAAFIDPPDDRVRYVTQWNHHCITCHSTGPLPGLNPRTGQLESRVGELGISCEACHGPGERHVQLHESRATNAKVESEPSDEAIVHPGRLDHVRSSEICGQCHGVFVAKNDEQAMRYAKEGIQFRPGDDLNLTRHYVRHPHEGSGAEAWAEYYRNESFYRDRWWEDGTILAGGREYTAMQESGCFQRGELTCLSCHSMHGATPDEQVKPGLRGSGACTQCHDDAQYTTEVTKHTHHASSSSGSDCLNCHMPYKSYALLGGIRSHDIDSPNLESPIKLGVPNACNLCHLDKTLAWTQSYLGDWFGQKAAPLNEEQRLTSAAVAWLLRGDAPRRVIAAWHFGWKPAQDVSGTDWMAPFVTRLLDDPYGVVRYVAVRSLRSLPGFSSFDFDFLGSADQLRDAVSRADRQYAGPAAPAKARPAVLIGDGGKFDRPRFDALYSHRDNRPASVSE